MAQAPKKKRKYPVWSQVVEEGHLCVSGCVCFLCFSFCSFCSLVLFRCVPIFAYVFLFFSDTFAIFDSNSPSPPKKKKTFPDLPSHPDPRRPPPNAPGTPKPSLAPLNPSRFLRILLFILVLLCPGPIAFSDKPRSQR